MRVSTEHQEDEKKREAERLLREDPKFAAGKFVAAYYIIFAIFLFLASGFWELQIRRPDYYSEAAQKNRVKSLPVLAARGKILDRDGGVLVDNKSSFSALLGRENLKEEHLQPIADGLGLDLQELKAKLERFQKRPRYQPIVIKEELTPAEISFVESHSDADTFPELDLIQSHVRYYPKEGTASHILGYVGEISDLELDMTDFAKYKPGDVVGKAGIEKQYNDMLTGTDGQRRVLVDNRGHEREAIGSTPAEPGHNLTLTIDMDVQVVAEMALEGKRGAVVALDPSNGEVLALASNPRYDPNKFAGRMTAEEWKAILDDPNKPLLNRAIQAQFAPGSTFKPLVAIAGLESGKIDPGFGVRCAGGATFYNHYHRCHARGGHGGVGLFHALAWSCDVFFYHVGDRVGIDTIAQYGAAAGLGKRTGIDLPHESEGVLPSTKWKARVRRQTWFGGDTINVAIGQGYVTMTPIQLAHSIGGLAVGGQWHKPHLLREETRRLSPVSTLKLTPEHVARVINGMHGVVNPGGTAYRAYLPGVTMCGKTGTAQLVSNDVAKNQRYLRRDLRDNAWFVGFAPKDKPEIVVAALFENGEHGDQAALIARDVIRAYFDKKARLAQDRKLLSSQQVLVPPAAVAP